MKQQFSVIELKPNQSMFFKRAMSQIILYMMIISAISSVVGQNVRKKIITAKDPAANGMRDLSYDAIVPFKVQASEYSNFFTSDGKPIGDCGSNKENPEIAGADGCDGCFVGLTEPGDWLIYEFESKNDVLVKLSARLASVHTNNHFRLMMDFDNVGHKHQSPGKGEQRYEDQVISEDLYVGKGLHRIRINFVDGDINLCSLKAGLVRTFLPSRGEKEIRIGGQNYQRTYEKSPEINSFGGCDRGDGVELVTSTDPTGGVCFVGGRKGEWLEYDVHVREKESFSIVARVSSGQPDNFFHIEVDGFDASGPVKGPGLGRRNFEDVYSITEQTFTPGHHTLRFVFDTGGVNLNYIKVIGAWYSESTYGSSLTPSTTPSSTDISPSSVNENDLYDSAASSKPSLNPSTVPSIAPSPTPSISPSEEPTFSPSSKPSSTPNAAPSLRPSVHPTNMPSLVPSYVPSRSPSTIPTLSDSFSKCGISQEERKNVMTETLQTVSDPALLFSPGTAQNMALKWILELDTLLLCPNDRFVQRFVMAVFYYSMGGGTWNQCNAPTDFSSAVSIAHANTKCSILGNGPDIFKKTIVQGTEAWLTPSHECYWGGLACVDSTLSMDRIEFENDGISGTIPSELQSLTGLRYLILEEGNIHGTIPSELGSFSLLHVLDLNFNQITGTIPVEIYETPFLFELDLNDNFLTGTIATEIGQLKHLRFLQLDANILSGTIPKEVGNMGFLRIAEFYANQLSGEMPKSVCDNRNTTGGSIFSLTADCKSDGDSHVSCSIPDCCTACPTLLDRFTIN